MSIKDARVFFDQLNLTEEQMAIADRLLKEICSRLKFLDDVGLDYLSLDRLASTLSGGEAQRIQLATHLGSSLVGALYVLDEPSIGLHPRDSARLIGLLENLRDIGNTVLVVEHEAEMMRAADHILDIGPGAGELGGKVVYEGNFENLLKDERSLTGRYLRGEAQIKTPKEHRLAGKHQLTIRGARAHNLKNVEVQIPLGQLVCITGVSGSGKSTLVHECLYAGIKKQRGDWTGAVGDFAAIEGGKFLDDIILVDQSPIGRTPRSNPVTYIKAYDAIREAFASTREAQAHSFNPSHFSFNVPGGRCDVCEGDGTVTVEMQFLADVQLVCEECSGKRFKQSVLDIKYRGKNIHEVLNLTVREAIAFFSQAPRIAAKLKVLEDVGLAAAATRGDCTLDTLMVGSTVNLTPVSLNSIEVTVEVVGMAPVAACPGNTFVVESKIGCLSPILMEADFPLTTRNLGDAKVLASESCLKKSTSTLAGRVNK